MLTPFPMAYRPPKPARQTYDGPDTFLQTGLIHHWYAGLPLLEGWFQDLTGGADIWVRNYQYETGWIRFKSTFSEQNMWGPQVTSESETNTSFADGSFTLNIFVSCKYSVSFMGEPMLSIGNPFGEGPFIAVGIYRDGILVAIKSGDFYYEGMFTKYGSGGFPASAFENRTLSIVVDKVANSVKVYSGAVLLDADQSYGEAFNYEFTPCKFTFVRSGSPSTPASNTASNEFFYQEIRIYDSALSGQDLVDSQVKTFTTIT